MVILYYDCANISIDIVTNCAIIFCAMCMIAQIYKMLYNEGERSEYMGKAATKAHNKYILKAYDRVNLTIPKGKKDTLQAHATARGESVNGMINRLLRAELGQTVEEWEHREHNTDD